VKPERHIFLTGFMGCGKTTLGMGLASLMNLEFTDLDELIAEKEGLSIPQLFERSGEAVFRTIENRRLTELLGATGPHVIALGGGTICHDHNLQLVKENGLLVYLRLPAAVLAQRLEGHTDNRPLVKGLSGEALKERITRLLEERQKYYNQAHLVVNALNMTPHLLYREIAASLQTALD
jgi:shikimate kinase